MSEAQSAALLVIGNELLSGKFEERNVAVLARLLFELGIKLQRVVVCPDEVEVIASDLRTLGAGHDYLFTSGGVGPTHDDVTMEGVAAAFEAPLERISELEDLLRGFFGPQVTEHHLRMADLPRGVELLWADDVRWPVPRLGNVYILPGLPEIFAMKMPVLKAHLPAGPPFVSRQVRTRSDEGRMAPTLRGLAERFPQVRIGSYPLWGQDAKLIVSFDGRSRELVERAARAFVEAVPADELMDQEP